jgi:hypothetical protein
MNGTWRQEYTSESYLPRWQTLRHVPERIFLSALRHRLEERDIPHSRRCLRQRHDLDSKIASYSAIEAEADAGANLHSFLKASSLNFYFSEHRIHLANMAFTPQIRLSASRWVTAITMSLNSRTRRVASEATSGGDGWQRNLQRFVPAADSIAHS